MYLNHFKLSERPFSITPDPRFIYMSTRHREALAHLLYGLGVGGGFVQLTGEVGTGKTTICRCLLEQVPENVDVALVLNPKVTSVELIATLCDELGVAYPPGTESIKTLTDALNRRLLDNHARGRRTVLIIDEAQNLSADVLEQIRLLTNLETAKQKLLQIILIGQPELRTLLERDDMRQLAQRVTARYHLEPIFRQDVGAYIEHRLKVCGAPGTLFSKAAVEHVQRLSGGIPRLINVLCDRALLGAYVEGKAQVSKKIVKKAAREVLNRQTGEEKRHRWVPLGIGALGILALIMISLRIPWPQLDRQVDLPGKKAGTSSEPMAADLKTGTLAPLMQKPAAALGREPVPGAPAGAGTLSGADDAAPTLAMLLAAADKSYYRRAWTQLFAQWAIVLPVTVQPDFCIFAKDNGMRCLYETGTWNSLRAYDRPALLNLVGEQGQLVPVVLWQLDESMANLLIGEQRYRIPLEQVVRHWHGDFVLLLRRPPGGSLYLKWGDRGPDIGWLRQQMEAILGQGLQADDPLLFDDALYRQVMEFQRSRGLLPDGVVGKYTLIQINSASQQPDVPRLTGSSS